MIRLAKPSVKYKTSFLAAIREFQKEGKKKEIDIKKLSRGFPSFLKECRDHDKGRSLPKGIVPQTTYWLVDGKEFIGRVSIRHRLNASLRNIGGHIGYEIRPSKRRRGHGTAILRLALKKAKALGIKKALLTCDATNTASRKIIEANGGLFWNKSKVQNVIRIRYWIRIV